MIGTRGRSSEHWTARAALPRRSMQLRHGGHVRSVHADFISGLNGFPTVEIRFPAEVVPRLTQHRRWYATPNCSDWPGDLLAAFSARARAGCTIRRCSNSAPAESRLPAD